MDPITQDKGSLTREVQTVKKDLAWSVFAIMVALVMFVVVACAAEPTAGAPARIAAGATQPGAAEKPRQGIPEFPQILMLAAVNPQVKNDPEVQTMLDKVIGDMQAVQQDAAARLAAFQQLVQAERGAVPDACKKAREDLNAAIQKQQADAKQVTQDAEPLEKKVRELHRAANGGNRPAPAAASLGK
jgi:hypothetical protein